MQCPIHGCWLPSCMSAHIIVPDYMIYLVAITYWSWTNINKFETVDFQSLRVNIPPRFRRHTRCIGHTFPGQSIPSFPDHDWWGEGRGGGGMRATKNSKLRDITVTYGHVGLVGRSHWQVAPNLCVKIEDVTIDTTYTYNVSSTCQLDSHTLHRPVFRYHCTLHPTGHQERERERETIDVVKILMGNQDRRQFHNFTITYLCEVSFIFAITATHWLNVETNTAKRRLKNHAGVRGKGREARGVQGEGGGGREKECTFVTHQWRIDLQDTGWGSRSRWI